jgi:N-acetylmuramoyl-L-alanine amidase
MKFLLYPLLLLFSLQALAFKVLVDPGHGGHDHGAVKNNLREADLVLNIAKDLVKLIEKDPSIDYEISRKHDKALELKDRKDHAHEAEADLFVSIHANASTSSRVRGVELYFQNILPPDENSNFLANRENKGEASQRGHRPSLFEHKTANKDVAGILDDMMRANYIKESYEFAVSTKEVWKKEMNTRRVKVRQAPFYVVSSVNMPSLLIEIGYVTNRYEAKRLRSRSYQRKIARSIYKAIKEYKSKHSH